MSTQGRLPSLPRNLPKTQAEWDQIANALQSWQKRLQTVTWVTPTLLNGWTNYGSPYEPAGYCVDSGGWVHLRGLVKSGTLGASTPIFVLPAGFIPPYTVIRGAISAEAICDVRIASVGDTSNGGSGAVIVSSGGSSTWVSLAGIAFNLQP